MKPTPHCFRVVPDKMSDLMFSITLLYIVVGPIPARLRANTVDTSLSV